MHSLGEISSPLGRFKATKKHSKYGGQDDESLPAGHRTPPSPPEATQLDSYLEREYRIISQISYQWQESDKTMGINHCK